MGRVIDVQMYDTYVIICVCIYTYICLHMDMYMYRYAYLFVYTNIHQHILHLKPCIARTYTPRSGAILAFLLYRLCVCCQAKQQVEAVSLGLGSLEV